MKLLIDDIPLQVLPGLAKAIGLNEALFLQQLHYWLNRSEHVHSGQRWIYNTAAEWKEQLPFWSEKTIRRVVKSLKDLGLIETTDRFNKRNYDKTTWFTINYEAVEKIENQSGATGQNDQSVSKPTGQNDQMELDNLSTPIPEITREKPSPPKKQVTVSRKHKQEKVVSPHAWFSSWWCYSYQQIEGRKYAYTKKDAGQINQLIKSLGLGDVVLRACSYFAMPEQKRFPAGPPTVGGLQLKINSLQEPEDDLIDSFVDSGLLPELGESLVNFQPWKEVTQNEQYFATA